MTVVKVKSVCQYLTPCILMTKHCTWTLGTYLLTYLTSSPRRKHSWQQNLLKLYFIRFSSVMFRCVQVCSGAFRMLTVARNCCGESTSTVFTGWAQVGRWALKMYSVPSRRRSGLHEPYWHSATVSQTWCGGCVHMTDERKFCRVSWCNGYCVRYVGFTLHRCAECIRNMMENLTVSIVVPLFVETHFVNWGNWNELENHFPEVL